MSRLVEHFFRSVINWLFRRRSSALIVMRTGLSCLTLAVSAGWVLNVSLPWREGRLEVNLNSAGGTPALTVYPAAFLGAVCLVFGLVWEISCCRADQRRLSRKKVIVIEARGLRDTSGEPLTEAVPRSLKGHREQVLVDLRQHVQDGLIVEPSAAVGRLNSLPADLDQRVNGVTGAIFPMCTAASHRFRLPF